MPPPEATEIAPGIHRMERIEPNGWSLNMILVDLGNRDLLVYSPTWFGEGTFEKVDAIGTPRVLFAPNHFHHVSLPRYRKRYPDAVPVTSPAARPRLTKKGHEGLRDLADVASLLPSSARFLACEGTKAGETFFSLESGSERTWVLADAFFNVERPVTGVGGVVLRTLKTIPGLCLGQTFPWLALRDRRAYLAWLAAQLDMEKPTRIVPCHGDAIARPSLAEELSRLAHQRLA
jgi:hypothetical protein